MTLFNKSSYKNTLQDCCIFAMISVRVRIHRVGVIISLCVIGVMAAIYFPRIRMLLYVLTLAMLVFDFKKMHRLIRKRISQEPSNIHPENNVVLAYANGDPIHIAVDVTRDAIPHAEACYSQPHTATGARANYCNTTEHLIRGATQLACMDNGEAKVSMLKLATPTCIRSRILGNGTSVVVKYVQQRDSVAHPHEIDEVDKKTGLVNSNLPFTPTPEPAQSNRRIHLNLSQFPNQGLQYEYTSQGKVVTKLVEMQNIDADVASPDEYQVHIVHSKMNMQPTFTLTDTEGNVHLLHPSGKGCTPTTASMPSKASVMFRHSKLSQAEDPLSSGGSVLQTLCKTHVVHEDDHKKFQYLKSLTNVKLKKNEKLVFYYNKSNSLKATKSQRCICSEFVIQERALTVATTMKTALVGGASLFIGCALACEVLA